jgi:hypothetical protein
MEREKLVQAFARHWNRGQLPNEGNLNRKEAQIQLSVGERDSAAIQEFLDCDSQRCIRGPLRAGGAPKFSNPA